MKSFLIPIIFLVIYGCSKDDLQAERSLKGKWTIYRIRSQYGTFFQNGFDPSDEVDESGQLGSFNFTQDSVVFNFQRNDTLYSGDTTWKLSSQKIRQGFFRESEFMVIIKGHYNFNVIFEDGSRNAEKNARELTLIEVPTEGYGVLIEIFMRKE